MAQTPHVVSNHLGARTWHRKVAYGSSGFNEMSKKLNQATTIQNVCKMV